MTDNDTVMMFGVSPQAGNPVGVQRLRAEAASTARRGRGCRLLPVTRRPSLGARAFTLIELLLAVVVFAIVLLAIHGVFYGALRLRNKTTQTLEAAVPLRQTLAILKQDLANIVVPGGTLFGGFQTTPTNDLSISQTGLNGATPTIGAILQGLSSPTFCTASGLLSDNVPWGEVQKVFYYLADPTNHTAGKDLYRSVTRNLLPTIQSESEDQWMMSGVEGLFFSYYDGTQWQTTWDSSTATTPLPQAIKVQIYLVAEPTESSEREPIEMVMPIVVGGATNQTETAQATEAQP